MPHTRITETRREFLETTTATALAGSLVGTSSGDEQKPPAGKPRPKKRIAIITTLWAYLLSLIHI